MRYKDNHVTLYNKDCRSMDLPDESVQCVVTSPPYWGLRLYSGEQELIWGDKDCKHEWQSIPPRRIRKETDVVDMMSKEGTNASAIDLPYTNTCSLCGAWKGAYGLEPQPDCGRPFAKLRKDLTVKEVEYVTEELKRCGLL